MRSTARDTLAHPVRRSLVKLGADIGVARRRRQLTVAMMVERVGVSKSTYLRVEKGDATVAMGVYAMVLFVLGFGTPCGAVADARQDDEGMLLGDERLPKRVRPKKAPVAR